MFVNHIVVVRYHININHIVVVRYLLIYSCFYHLWRSVTPICCSFKQSFKVSLRSSWRIAIVLVAMGTINNLIINSIERIRKKTNKRSDESTIIGFIGSKDKNMDTLLTQNVTLGNKQTNVKNSFCIKDLNILKENKDYGKTPFVSDLSNVPA